jgi:tetratricopeptide (TPR) repeat protein
VTLAQGHKKRGAFAEAAAEYLRLVVILGQERGSGSIAVFEALSQLADIYQAQNKFPESIIAYRQVLAGYKETFGPSALETLRIVHSLGKVLEESNEYEEAESCYRQAITGFKELGTSGFLDQLNCQSFLGDLLSDMERHEEALRLLRHTLVGYDDLGLHHRRISILGSLLEISISIKHWPSVHALLRDMQKSLDERLDIDYESFPEVLLEGIHLGSVYCQLLEYELAESLMSQVIPKIEILDDATYEIEKIYAYMEYGRANLRLGVLEQAAFYLNWAKYGLEKLNRHDDPVVAFVDARLLELEFRSVNSRDKTALGREMLMVMEMIGVSIPSHDAGDEAVSEGSRIGGEDATDVDTSSYKYGVTFSTTDITGVSISEFLTA